MKTIGLIGGLSWHSTVEYYSYINQMVNDINADNTNAPLILFNINQKLIHELQKKNDWDSISMILIDAGERLKKAGAHALLFCANTPHRVFNKVQDAVGIPILHIADATGIEIKEKKLKKVGLIGTIYTMEGNFISGTLNEKYHVQVIIPESKSSRKELQRIIQEELSLGILKDISKQYILKEIQELKAKGAEGIILGCTEFPLIIKENDIDIPLFNTTYLHAKYAVQFITKEYDK